MGEAAGSDLVSRVWELGDDGTDSQHVPGFTVPDTALEAFACGHAVSSPLKPVLFTNLTARWGP